MTSLNFRQLIENVSIENINTYSYYLKILKDQVILKFRLYNGKNRGDPLLYSSTLLLQESFHGRVNDQNWPLGSFDLTHVSLICLGLRCIPTKFSQIYTKLSWKKVHTCQQTFQQRLNLCQNRCPLVKVFTVYEI